MLCRIRLRKGMSDACETLPKTAQVDPVSNIIHSGQYTGLPNGDRSTNPVLRCLKPRQQVCDVDLLKARLGMKIQVTCDLYLI